MEGAAPLDDAGHGRRRNQDAAKTSHYARHALTET
jgi:hypothetical protein